MASLIKIFRNSDSGAPVISGSAGTLIAALDACLISGYNSKTVTITRSGTTATATATAHGFPTDGLVVIRISGANEVDYNGDFKIFNVTTNTFDFTVANAPATPATGVITAIMCPADTWVKSFTGTNLAVYRTSDVTGGNREFYRFDDTTTKYTSVRGYERMSDVNSGIDPTNVVYFQKSSTADATVRAWTIVADDRFVHVFIGWWATYASQTHFGFGDLTSVLPGDVYNGCVIGTTTSAPASVELGESFWHNSPSEVCDFGTGYKSAGRITRSGNAAIKNVAIALIYPFNDRPTSASTLPYIPGGYTSGQNLPSTNPNPTTGSFDCYQSAIWEVNNVTVPPANTGIRGVIPGIWAPLQVLPVNTGSTYTSSAPTTSGRKFLAITQGYVINGAGYFGQYHIDLTGPWR